MFDATALDPLRPKLVEIGRVTVAPEHRNGAVMGILWAGIFRYQQMTEHQYAIGCLSVRMEDGGPRGSLVRSVHDFAQRFAAPRSIGSYRAGPSWSMVCRWKTYRPRRRRRFLRCCMDACASADVSAGPVLRPGVRYGGLSGVGYQRYCASTLSGASGAVPCSRIVMRLMMCSVSGSGRRTLPWR